MKTRIRFGSLTMFAIAVFLVIASAPYAKDYLETRRCGKHLAAISQAALVWADAHNGRLPSGFILMSNELVSPRLLLCPADKSREPASDWHALTAANSSYQMEGALGARDLPPDVRKIVSYLQCKVHGYYANALGKVFIFNPIPLGAALLASLALVAFVGGCLWQRYKPVQAQFPDDTAADLLPRIEQMRHDYLAEHKMPASPWYRRGLIAAARQAVRALAFFREKKDNPHGRENPRAA